MDPMLLARMTGRLGDRRTIDAIAGALAAALAEPLEGALGKSTATVLKVEPAGSVAGMRGEIAAPFDETVVLCEAMIEGWCDDVLLACDSGLVVAATERLLGGWSEGPFAPRALSDIERDIALMLFEAFGNALWATVKNTAAGCDCGKAFAGPLKRASDVHDDDFVAKLSFSVAFEETLFRMHVVLPQSVLLKAVIVSIDNSGERAAAQRPQWVEQLAQKVHTSNVTLQANVRLAPVTLAATSRLQPGDVLPFADEKDVRVLLKANGKNLYWCEFGKSGNRYMLRLQDRYGSEEDFVRQLTA